ncbi:MAG: hypothetical protein WCT32_03230 [Patescibacteria group bacterium]|jgi:uncharacterized membrane protein
MPAKSGLAIHHKIREKAKHIARQVSKRIKPKKKKQNDFPLIENNVKSRIMAALSYVHVVVLVPLVFARKNSYVKFHAKQGVGLLIIWLLALLLFWVPIVGWLLVLVSVAGLFFGVTSALTGQEKRLPVIGRMAQSFKV